MKCIECMREIGEERLECPYCGEKQTVLPLNKPTTATKWAIVASIFAFIFAVFSWMSQSFLWGAFILGITGIAATIYAQRRGEKFAKFGITLSSIALVFVVIFTIGWISEGILARDKAKSIAEELDIFLVDKKPTSKDYAYDAQTRMWEEHLFYYYTLDEIVQMNQEVEENSRWINELSLPQKTFFEVFEAIDLDLLELETTYFILYDRKTNSFSTPESLDAYDFILIVYVPNESEAYQLIIHSFAKSILPS